MCVVVKCRRKEQIMRDEMYAAPLQRHRAREDWLHAVKIGFTQTTKRLQASLEISRLFIG